MVGWMTYGVRKFEHLDMPMRELIKDLDALMREMIPMIDRDTNAFNAYMDAMKLPKKTPEEIQRRDAAMQDGLKTAVQVPLQGMRTASKAWASMTEMAKIGNIKSMSDLQVGAKCLETGIWGCYQNVLINLGDVKDEAFKAEVLAECEQIMQRTEKGLAEVLEILEKRKQDGENSLVCWHTLLGSLCVPGGNELKWDEMKRPILMKKTLFFCFEAQKRCRWDRDRGGVRF